MPVALLNVAETVQVSDTTMLGKEILLVTKKINQSKSLQIERCKITTHGIYYLWRHRRFMLAQTDTGIVQFIFRQLDAG